MEIKISPRSIKDRGGYICMPLKKNIPEGRTDWTLTTCPVCGTECWQMPTMELPLQQGAKAMCTMCALKEGVKKRWEK